MPCPILQASRTIDYESAPFLMTTGLEKHERRIDHMIYLTFFTVS